MSAWRSNRCPRAATGAGRGPACRVAGVEGGGARRTGFPWTKVSANRPERKRRAGNQIHFIRTNHIGRPVFATNDLGVKVWEASYLPFGGVHVATGGIDLRFPGQWYQAESGLYQN